MVRRVATQNVVIEAVACKRKCNFSHNGDRTYRNKTATRNRTKAGM